MTKMSWREFIISHQGVDADAISGALFGLGCEGLTEEEGVIKAYFPEAADIAGIEDMLSMFDGVSFTVTVVEDQDWYKGWKEGFGPFSVYDLYICPPWKSEECKPGPDDKFILMDPGEAFGTGDHDSTVMVIGMLREWASGQDDIGRRRVLDLGTGTGILSVAAYQYGARDITAVDVERKAVESAGRNFALNGMVGKVRLMPGSIADAGTGYDLVLANIFQEVLIDVMPGIATALSPGGKAIISGLLSGQEDKVMSVAVKCGLRQAEKAVRNGWVCLMLSA